MKTIDIENIENIDELKNFLHDRFYEIEKIEYHDTTGQLVIPTSIVLDEPVTLKKRIFKSKEYPVMRACLQIYDVSNYQAIDEDNIGEGDFGSISYNGDEITISGSSPTKLIVRVKNFHMSLQISDEIIKSISIFRKNYLRS